MKKIIFIALAFLSIVFLPSCKSAQQATNNVNTVCSISSTLCPVVSNLLNVGASVIVTPTNNTQQVLISAAGISPIICDAINGICPVIDTALAHGQSVTLTPTQHSSSAMLKSASSIEVIVAVHKK